MCPCAIQSINKHSSYTKKDYTTWTCLGFDIALCPVFDDQIIVYQMPRNWMIVRAYQFDERLNVRLQLYWFVCNPFLISSCFTAMNFRFENPIECVTISIIVWWFVKSLLIWIVSCYKYNKSAMVIENVSYSNFPFFFISIPFSIYWSLIIASICTPFETIHRLNLF